MMKQPTGKLKFAYDSIIKLELEVNKQRLIIWDLVNALEPFVDSCYKGCSKSELDKLRIEAEKTLNSLK